jgi:L-2-hydroxycarboxylate dehydrogenase (NAD+)
VLVQAARAQNLVAASLRRAGASPENADAQAHLLIEGDLRGHPSHGIQRLPLLVERIGRGLLDAKATPRGEWISASAVLVDGKRGFGAVAGRRAIALINERASETGIAVAAVRNANHLGMLAPYVEEAASFGSVAVAFTTSEALVHPAGGTVAMVGTNPISIAIPAVPHPMVADVATGVVSMGKILAYGNRNEAIPEGWARDASGNPTTDPIEAAAGAIAPFGGGKGYALGLAIELLVSSLTGSALGRDVHGTLDATQVSNKGDVFLCFKPERFGVSGFADLATVYLNDLRASPAVPGEVAVRVPGDRARDARTKSLNEGFNVPEVVWRQLLDLAGVQEGMSASTGFGA